MSDILDRLTSNKHEQLGSQTVVITVSFPGQTLAPSKLYDFVEN